MNGWIKILSVEDTIDRLQSPVDAAVISIRDDYMDPNIYKAVDCFAHQNAQGMLVLRFDDVSYEIMEVEAPQMCHLELALEFARQHRNVIVHCTAGISRSSAIAFLISYDRLRNFDEARKILDFQRHSPNIRLIRFGEELFQTKFRFFDPNYEKYIQFMEASRLDNDLTDEDVRGFVNALLKIDSGKEESGL